MDYWDLPERGIRRELAGVVVVYEERGYILHVHHVSKDDLEAYCGPKEGHAGLFA